MLPHFRDALTFLNEALDKNERIIVHCGRGISRSATLVIALIMQRQQTSYIDAYVLFLLFHFLCRFGVVSGARACVYPNVGFQLQLCLFEKYGDDALKRDFDIAKEIAHSIDQTLDNVAERLEAVFEDDAVIAEPSRWMDFGFFFQNCREYLGHVDIGLPTSLLAKADDVARKLKNLEAVFEGPGVAVAARVGRVLDVWQALQFRMAHAQGALPYVLALF